MVRSSLRRLAERLCIENPLTDGVAWCLRRLGILPPAPARDDAAPADGGREPAPLSDAAAEESEDFLSRLKQRFLARQERRDRRRQDREAARAAASAATAAAARREPDAPLPAGPEEGAVRAESAATPAPAPTQPALELGPARPCVPPEPPPPPEPLPDPWPLPSPDGLLKPDTGAGTTVTEEEITGNRRIIQETLDNFAIDAEVASAVSGPRVTLFEVDPAPGVKVESISAIGNNLAMELAAESLRILAPVPGQRFVGIEVPNRTAAPVRLRGLLADPQWTENAALIPLPIGRNIRGENIFLDLARAPHLLVAGATGSGKSVCLNSMLLSLLFRFGPEQLRLILVDPKVVEFAVYKDLPHLLTPVINDTKQVPFALQWVITEMEWRYRVLAAAGVRHLEGFNKRAPRSGEVDDDGNPLPARLPFIVVVIDELADIMMTAGDEVETLLARIAQLSRAVGIHTVIATQRPSVNVITGVIKANYPTRIAFQVSSQVDSRTILDGKGAESLLGRGDMLYKAPGGARVMRVQAPMVDDLEIESVVADVCGRAKPQFVEAVVKPRQPDLPGVPGAAGGGAGDDADEELIRQAIDVIVHDRRATTSYVQRRLRIGYNRAALIMETLEKRGVIGPQIGAAPREILIETAEE